MIVVPNYNPSTQYLTLAEVDENPVFKTESKSDLLIIFSDISQEILDFVRDHFSQINFLSEGGPTLLNQIKGIPECDYGLRQIVKKIEKKILKVDSRQTKQEKIIVNYYLDIFKEYKWKKIRVEVESFKNEQLDLEIIENMKKQNLIRTDFSLFDDKDFMLEAIHVNPKFFFEASPKLKLDPEIQQVYNQNSK